MVFYIKAAAHDIVSHTNPPMYGYFPSNWTAHYGPKVNMKMAGATVLFNEPVLQQHIMKWGILCALTKDCIQPTLRYNYEKIILL